MPAIPIAVTCGEPAGIGPEIAAKARAAGVDERSVAADMVSGVPAGRFARAEEPAALIAFLCSEAAGYIDGSSIAVDGGRTRCI